MIYISINCTVRDLYCSLDNSKWPRPPWKHDTLHIMVIRDKNQGYCYFASTEIIIITHQFYGSNCLMHFDKKMLACWKICKSHLRKENVSPILDTNSPKGFVNIWSYKWLIEFMLTCRLDMDGYQSYNAGFWWYSTSLGTCKGSNSSHLALMELCELPMRGL